MSAWPGLTAILGAGLLLTACGGAQEEPAVPDPVPGLLELRFTTPNPTDRAVLVAVSGPDVIQSVEGAGAGYVLHARLSGSSFKAALFGPLAGGPLLRFAVPDVGKAEAYRAAVVEVADDANSLRASLAGYTLTVVR